MRLRLWAAALLWAGAAAAEPLHVTVIPVEVTMPAEARLELLSAVELRARHPDFGGYSAIELARDGAHFVALSDQADWFEGRLRREGDRIVAVEDARTRPLLRPEGRGAIVWRDAEALEIPDPDLDGPRWVAFERRHRIGFFAGPDAPERTVALAVDTSDWPPNDGLEGLALAPDGRLLALLEVKDLEARGLAAVPAWWLTPDDPADPTRLDGVATALPPPGRFAVTGADFGPDGRLYVLGRTFGVLGGFSFGVFRYEVAGDALTGPEVLLELAGSAGADNAEGISVRRDAQGRLRVTVITDDNFNLLQRTIIYDFAAPD